ncbi:MAG TPA: radical SAM protein [Candidatus Bathyarchaeia archaeon]|nr:radical SAM protein [Candidatus Bathyarchaeia archaeon]
MNIFYFHWPFGLRQCCRFFSAPYMSERKGDPRLYTQVITTELRRYIEKESICHLEAVYMSGVQANDDADRYLLDIAGILDIQYQRETTPEVTVEVHPACITEDYMQRWKDYGVNRVNIGIHTVADMGLAKKRVRQMVQDRYYAVDLVTQMYENTALELTVGLPGVTDAEWLEYMQKLLKYPVKHITFSWFDASCSERRQNRAEKLRQKTHALLLHHGFEQYARSSYARAGYQSRYMTALWKGQAYKGFGLGACSYNGTTLQVNIKNFSSYKKAVDGGFDPHNTRRAHDHAEEQLLRIRAGLELVDGVAYADVIVCFNEQQQRRVMEVLQLLQKQRLLTHDKERVRLTFKGMLVKDAIMRFLKNIKCDSIQSV